MQSAVELAVFVLLRDQGRKRDEPGPDARDRQAHPPSHEVDGFFAELQKPIIRKAAKEHKIYPFLLCGTCVARPNQVWCADITYLPMRRGILYLVAIVDWRTRKALVWRISTTLEAEFRVDSLIEAIRKFGPTDIVNTDQGSQRTLLLGQIDCDDQMPASQCTVQAVSSTIFSANGCGDL